ncbi:MAG: response regulator transcription factor [Eggerthellaceae bacterium]
MTTILLIEDDPTIRLATEFSLTKHGYAVSTCEDGLSGYKAALSIEPDLILLDVMLPGMNGFEVASKLRKEGCNSPILMLTALDADEDKINGLDAGADDYITKPFSTEVLLARIRANVRRTELDGVNLSNPQTYGDLTLDPENSTASVKGKTLKLRSKELALLFALAERQGMLCRRTWLTQTVWKEDYLSTSRTIDVHIRRLRSVLDEVSDYTYIHTVHGMGYRFEPVRKSEE